MSKVIVVNGNDCYHGVTLRYENVISVTTESLGWTQQWGQVPYGDGVVTQLIGYIGGEGTQPTENIGYYIGIDGFVENIEDAVISGLQGDQGNQGYTPYVGSNDNWWINGEDTGFPSRGANGDLSVLSIVDGIWFIDGESTGQKAQGEDGKAIELGKSSDYIQWRYVGDAEWINLVSLDDLKGENGIDGDDGKSAYQIWLDEGNAGTVQEYLDSLKGKDGENGTDANVTEENITDALGYTPVSKIYIDESLEDYIPLTQKGSPDGVAELDDQGKFLLSQTPDSIIGGIGATVVNINPDSAMPIARLWIGTQVQFDTQQPIPDDVLVFIEDNND